MLRLLPDELLLPALAGRGVLQRRQRLRRRRRLLLGDRRDRHDAQPRGQRALDHRVQRRDGLAVLVGFWSDFNVRL